MPERGDLFYVGWQPHAPATLARHTRRAAVTLLFLAVGLAVALAALQRRAEEGTFEFGTLRPLVGLVAADDPPRLLVPQPGAGSGVSSYLLVAPWKHGAGSLIAPWRGRAVALRGTLIWRAGHTLVEVQPGSIQEAPREAVGESVAGLGRRTLRGEIVDSKCFLGVMKPGTGTLHRACAVRCLAGGIPPALRTEEGVVLLLREDGRVPGAEILPFVAEPVSVTGTLERHGDRLVLRMDAGGLRPADRPS